VPSAPGGAACGAPPLICEPGATKSGFWRPSVQGPISEKLAIWLALDGLAVIRVAIVVRLHILRRADADRVFGGAARLIDHHVAAAIGISGGKDEDHFLVARGRVRRRSRLGIPHQSIQFLRIGIVPATIGIVAPAIIADANAILITL